MSEQVSTGQDINQLKEIIENPNVNGFISYQEQYMIFDTLLSSGMNPFGSSVLHYGCGNGEFVRYAYSKLSEQQRQSTLITKFLGYDTRPDVVQAANTIYEHIANTTFTSDSNEIDELEDDAYDWVIAPHYFIYQNPDMESNQINYIIDEISKLFRVSKHGVLITLLKDNTDLTDDEKEVVLTTNKIEAYSKLLNITDNVTIVDNYSDTEYTVFLHKISK